MAALDFDPEDYLDEIETADLVRELERRRSSVPDDVHDLLTELFIALRDGRLLDAVTLSERLAFPKWSSVESARLAWAQAMRAHPKGVNHEI